MLLFTEVVDRSTDVQCRALWTLLTVFVSPLFPIQLAPLKKEYVGFWNHFVTIYGFLLHYEI
jgi:hypothetical protein